MDLPRRSCRAHAVVAWALLGACSSAGGASKATPDASAAPHAAHPPPEATPRPPCAQCVIEDLREAAHREQIIVTARYLGLEQRWLDGHRTRRACTRADEVTGVVRFALTGPSPWHDPDAAKVLALDLPCPELSRPAYAQLYRYDPDDTQRDGLGHAPRLRAGQSYRLTFARDPHLVMREPTHPGRARFAPTLIAVNPALDPAGVR